MDTLAVRLTLPTAKRVADFHRQVIAHVGRTKRVRYTNLCTEHVLRYVSVIYQIQG